ncbi:uncharacterized protein LOC135393507 [Ornithodoros turicata]|uniref:uncharacterized protein LOC135393507 n=1 Tax=Ornithodoros turicata TaxID=34597 RepID=UPI00313995CF
MERRLNDPPQPGDTPTGHEPYDGTKDDGSPKKLKQKTRQRKDKKKSRKKTQLATEPAVMVTDARTPSIICQQWPSVTFTDMRAEETPNAPSLALSENLSSLLFNGTSVEPGSVVTPRQPPVLAHSAGHVKEDRRNLSPAAGKLSPDRASPAAHKLTAAEADETSKSADADEAPTGKPLRPALRTPKHERLASKSIVTDISSGYLIEGDVDLIRSLVTSEATEDTSHSGGPSCIETELVPSEYAYRNNFHWIFYTLLHCVAAAIVSLLTRRLKLVPKGKITFYISLSLLVNSMPGAFGVKRPFGPMNLQPLIFLRSFFAVSASIFRAMALVFLQISDVVAIGTLIPMGVSVASAIVLREKIYKLQWIAMILNVLGVVFIIQPASLYGGQGYELNHLTGVLMALGSVLSIVQLLVVVRYMRNMTALRLSFNCSCSRVALSLAVTMLTGGYRDLFVGRFMGSLVMLSDVNFASLVLLGRALSQETAAAVTTLKQCIDIVLSILVEIIFLNEYPNEWGLAGSTVILFSSFLVGYDKIMRSYKWNVLAGIRKADGRTTRTEH